MKKTGKMGNLAVGALSLAIVATTTLMPFTTGVAYGTNTSQTGTVPAGATTTPAVTSQQAGTNAQQPATGTPDTQPQKKTFSDLNGHWAKAVVEEAAALGIVGGYPEGDFKPDNLLKREEFFKMVVNILNQQPVYTDESNKKFATFGDVIPNEWYVDTVKKAVAAGITEGNTFYSFGIGMMVTRQEAAKIISTIVPNEIVAAESIIREREAKFEVIKDKAKIDTWAYEHVKKVFKKGYIQGDDQGNFNPTNALTRAEAATLLMNVVRHESAILGPKQAKPAETTGTAITTGQGIGKDPAFAQFDDKEEKITPKSVKCSDIGCAGDHDKNKFEGETFAGGTGTIADPYVIETDKQLNHVREHVQDGAYFIFSKDIYISRDFAKKVEGNSDSEIWGDGNFAPIGTVDEPFNGHIDGNGYSIYDMEISGKQRYTGLIAYLSKNGSVEKLTMEDCLINGGQYVGAVVGYNEGTVSLCSTGKGTKVSGSNLVGGVAGYTEAALMKCRNKGKVECAMAGAGGIVGGATLNNQYITECVNEGSVFGIQKVGGIIGTASGTGKGLLIEKCSNRGVVESQSYNAGGIVGETTSNSSETKVSTCFNRGEVKGNSLNGGIVAIADTNTTISKCANEGKVYGTVAGGICGNNAGIIEKCANIGSVDSKLNSGGIAAVQEEEGAEAVNCFNSGVVSSGDTAGGIVGENSRRVKCSYNTGEVKAAAVAGGIAGRNKGTATIAYNLGSLQGNIVGEVVGINAGNLSYIFWKDGGKLSSVGQYESSYTQTATAAKALTEAQLAGTEKVQLRTAEKKDMENYFVSILNDLAGRDAAWETVKTYKYPSIEENSYRK